MNKLHNYLSNISLFKFVIIAVIPRMILTLFAMWVANTIIPFPSDFNEISISNIYVELLSVGIIGPFIETLIFQSLIVSLVLSFSKNETRKAKIISVICSAFIFGLSHYLSTMNSSIFWSIWYGFMSGLFGVILGYSYIIYYNKTNSHKRAIFVTFIIHALNNLLAYIIPNII